MSAKEGTAGYLLLRAKMFVPDAGVSDYLVCAARIGGEPALFVVPAAAPGVRIEPMPSIDATRPLYAVAFDRVPLHEEDLLARGEQAQAALDYALNVATTAL